MYQLCKEGFYLDKFYSGVCVKIYNIIGNFSNFIELKLLSNYSPVIWCSKFCVKVFKFIEDKIMNGGVNFISDSFSKFSIFDLKCQNGNLQRYNTYAFVILTLILLGILLGYVLILYIEVFRG